MKKEGELIPLNRGKEIEMKRLAVQVAEHLENLDKLFALVEEKIRFQEALLIQEEQAGRDTKNVVHEIHRLEEKQDEIIEMKAKAVDKHLEVQEEELRQMEISEAQLQRALAEKDDS